MAGPLQPQMLAAPFAMSLGQSSAGSYMGLETPSTSAAQISADISASLALLLQQQELQVQQQQRLPMQQPQQVPALVEHELASQVQQPHMPGPVGLCYEPGEVFHDVVFHDTFLRCLTGRGVFDVASSSCCRRFHLRLLAPIKGATQPFRSTLADQMGRALQVAQHFLSFPAWHAACV